MEKLDLTTPNFTDENIQKLSELFPNCVTESSEGKVIDFDALKQELSSNIIEGNKERYQLTWPGKAESLVTANTPINKTLRPNREESKDFDNTENLYIEGDNLEVLKLLQETYLGKVKMIYIDPPYNTGKDFVYKDNFTQDKAEYDAESGNVDDEGGRLVSNPDSNGRYHSDWLSMMYPRLKLARNLLKDDGVVFISVDEVEQSNLKKVCDEVFGEANFVECICWNKRIPKNDKGVGNIHEYILLYVRGNSSKHVFNMRKDGLNDIYELTKKLKNKKIPLHDAEKEIKKLYKKNGYDRGITLYNAFDDQYKLWGKINMSWPNANTFGPTYEVLHPKNGKPVKIPDRGWRWKRETFDEAAIYENGEYKEVKKLHDGSFMCGKIWFASDENTQPSSITFLDDVNTFLLRSILSFKSNGGIELENLFDGKSYFSYPKPTQLLRVLFSSNKTKDGELFLDFFSGSATTAHAVMQLNAEDGGKRKFIMAQISEATDKKSEAYNADYKTIAEIGKERIRRAGEKIKEDNADKDGINELDTGFRVLKVDSSNMKDVYFSPDNTSQGDMVEWASNIKDGRDDEDLLFMVLLDWGIDLSVKIERREIAGKTVYFADDDYLAACFEDNLDEDFVKALVAQNPLKVVFRDNGFANDSVKINVEQIFKQADIEVKVI